MVYTCYICSVTCNWMLCVTCFKQLHEFVVACNWKLVTKPKISSSEINIKTIFFCGKTKGLKLLVPICVELDLEPNSFWKLKLRFFIKMNFFPNIGIKHIYVIHNMVEIWIIKSYFQLHNNKHICSHLGNPFFMYEIHQHHIIQ